MSSPIHQEIVFAASAKRLYEALTDSAQFSRLSGGAPARMSAEAGGVFSCFGGMIEGRNIELVPARRIVQAWRVAAWIPGVYSIARFEFDERGPQTRLVFDHAGFPEDQGEHLAAGWRTNYWEPLRKFLEEGA